MDTKVDARLGEIGAAAVAGLRGQAAIANARLAYQHSERMLGSPRWAALQAALLGPKSGDWSVTGDLACRS